MSSSYSSLDWVLTHWAHFTVHRLIYLCLSLYILCVFVLYCICVVLLWAWWGGPDVIEAWSLGPILLQCFDTVGWVKPVPDMTYNVFGGMLNLAQSIYISKMTCYYVSTGKLNSSQSFCLRMMKSFCACLHTRTAVLVL